MQRLFGAQPGDHFRNGRRRAGWRDMQGWMAVRRRDRRMILGQGHGKILAKFRTRLNGR
jgi:hypothetical protein